MLELFKKIRNDEFLADIEMRAIIYFCKAVGKFNHNVRKLISFTTNFRTSFVNWLDTHFTECIEENNLLCLLAELIENDKIAIKELVTKITLEFENIKELYNFYTLSYSILNNYYSVPLMQLILSKQCI